MRARTIVVLLTAVLVLPWSALAAPAASDPLSLVLQQSDLPAKTKYVNGRMPTVEKALAAARLPASAAFFSGTLTVSPTSYDTFSGSVFVLKNVGDAQKVYRLTKADLAPKPGSIVRLANYGDEQVGWWTQSVGKAELLVRKGSVVWLLDVNPGRVVTKSRTVATLQTYAAKQKRRIRSG